MPKESNEQSIVDEMAVLAQGKLDRFQALIDQGSPNAVREMLISMGADDRNFIQGLMMEGNETLSPTTRRAVCDVFLGIVRFEFEAEGLPQELREKLGIVLARAVEEDIGTVEGVRAVYEVWGEASTLARELGDADPEMSAYITSLYS